MSRNNSSDVIVIARPTRQHLEKDQVFGRRDRNHSIRELHFWGTRNELLLKTSQAEGEIYFNLCLAMPDRENERSANDLDHIGKQWPKPTTRQSIDHRQRAVHIDSDHHIHVGSESRFAAHAGRDASDDRKWNSLNFQEICEIIQGPVKCVTHGCVDPMP